MDVPLSRFLSRFSVEEELVDEPVIVEEIEAPAPPSEDPTRAIVASALEEAAKHHEHKVSALQLEHEAAVEKLLADARQTWAASEGEKLAQALDGCMSNLRDLLSNKIGDALTPLVGYAVVQRARAALLEGIEAIVSDPDHPALSLHAPGDLLDAVRAANPRTKGIRYIPHDDIDAIVTADGLRIETRLHAVLPSLAELDL